MGVTFAFLPWMPMRMQMKMLGPALGITFVALLVGTFFFSVNALLGRRILFNFFSGRYHRPREEQRIFIFLDLTSSTTIAERIGHIRFHEFLNDFIFDITDIIIDSYGEIYKYVGDEVIAVWFLKGRNANSACLACYFDILDRLETRRDYYEKAYGFVPAFKAGIHCGPVVAGEMGDDKKEIAFLGDVVNTTARIQEEAKRLGKGLLISRSLLGAMELPAGITSQSVGTVKLRGKESGLELFSVDSTR
jgi:adenylate cyclase